MRILVIGDGRRLREIRKTGILLEDERMLRESVKYFLNLTLII